MRRTQSFEIFADLKSFPNLKKHTDFISYRSLFRKSTTCDFGDRFMDKIRVTITIETTRKRKEKK
jgi:hypothetical protein